MPRPSTEDFLRDVSVVLRTHFPDWSHVERNVCLVHILEMVREIENPTPLGRRKPYPDEMLRERFEALVKALTRCATPGSKTKFGPTLEPFAMRWWRHGLDELVEAGFTLPKASYPQGEIAKWSGLNPPKGGVKELAYFLFKKRLKISRSKIEKLPP
jgi:hypothetical protein